MRAEWIAEQGTRSSVRRGGVGRRAMGALCLAALAWLGAAPGARAFFEAAPRPAPAPADETTFKPVTMTVDLGHGAKLTMVSIPAGTFLMGSPWGESGRNSNEGPQSEVHVGHFWMGQTEVTQAQYEAIMGTNPSHFKGPDLPVEQVSWNDAMAFCKKLAAKTGKPFTLPTEAQWEYAARGGKNQGAFIGGNSTRSLAADTWYQNDSDKHTHPVATKAPNAFHLYDMQGNVWEWTLSELKPYPYRADDGRNDPNAKGIRVMRGGSWVDSTWGVRLAYRPGIDPNLRFYSFGFRVALPGGAGR